MQSNVVLQQIAIYLRVIHGIDLDFDERTCDCELSYYAINLHDDVLYDAVVYASKESTNFSAEKFLYGNRILN